jgi:hypothetical protein
MAKLLDKSRCEVPAVGFRLLTFWAIMTSVNTGASGPARMEEPWVMPREYELGAVRWFSEAVTEIPREERAGGWCRAHV